MKYTYSTYTEAAATWSPVQQERDYQFDVFCNGIQMVVWNVMYV